ncbi:uncharacterized protein LOC143922681 [Arctopsyche grandis]|uniref:uncharacterized protein LOC143922681 n=1 Tax=Arctopsyche grandis TaxID=121162 RepID=UPI00406D76F1
MEVKCEPPEDPTNPQISAPIVPEELYDQIDDFDFSQQLRQLLETNESLRGDIEDLKIDIKTVTEKCTNLENENDTLQTNISTLYKTATAEIKRKDRMFNEVRAELDQLKLSQVLNVKNDHNNCTGPNLSNAVHTNSESLMSSSRPVEVTYQKAKSKPDINLHKKRISESNPRFNERQLEGTENKANYPYDNYERKRPRTPSPHRSNRRSPKWRYLEHSNRSRSGSRNRSERYYSR